MTDAGRYRMAGEVLATARDHEKRIYSGSGVPASESIPFLRLVKELAIGLIQDESDDARSQT